MIYFFEFVYILDDVNDFSHIEPTLLPWDEAYLIVVCSWIQFLRILLRNFASIFIREIGLKFSFVFFGYFCDLDIRVIVAL